MSTPPVDSPGAPLGPERAATRAPDAATRVWAGLRVLVLEQEAQRRAVCEALGLSFVRIKALRRLVAAPLTQRALAEALTTDKAYTTVIVDDLERRGLITRSPHPRDRRAKVVALTDEGRAAAARSEDILGVPPSALSTMDSADLATLERLVTALLREPATPR